MNPICQRYLIGDKFCILDRSVYKTYIEIESKMHLIHRSCQVDCQNSPISNGSDFMIQKGEIKMELCNV